MEDFATHHYPSHAPNLGINWVHLPAHFLSDSFVVTVVLLKFRQKYYLFSNLAKFRQKCSRSTACVFQNSETIMTASIEYINVNKLDEYELTGSENRSILNKSTTLRNANVP